jgi:hypothetical protein
MDAVICRQGEVGDVLTPCNMRVNSEDGEGFLMETGLQMGIMQKCQTSNERVSEIGEIGRVDESGVGRW